MNAQTRWYPRLMTRSEQIIEEQDGREEAMPKTYKMPDRVAWALSLCTPEDRSLLEAAPDMLAELRRIYEFLDKAQSIAKIGADLDCVDAFGAFGTAKNSIAATIAKAEGKNQE